MESLCSHSVSCAFLTSLIYYLGQAIMGILWGFLHELELVLHAVQLRLLSAPIPQASSEQTGIWGTGDLPVFHPPLYQLSLTSNPLIHAIASLPNIHFPS